MFYIKKNALTRPSKELVNTIISKYHTYRYDEVENLALSLTKSFPDFLFGWKILGAAYLNSNKLQKAVNINNKIITEFKNDVETFINQGLTMQKLGKLSESIQMLNKAIELNPNYPEAYYNLGITLKMMRQPEMAVQEYKKAIKLNSGYRQAYNNLGVAYIDLGKFDTSVDYFVKALNLKDDYIEAWNNIYMPLLINNSLENKKKTFCSSKILKQLNKLNKKRAATLKYRLYEGTENSFNCFNEVISTLSLCEEKTLKNPNYDKISSDVKKSEPENIFALLHFGRSGTGLFHSLIDDHKEIITLPSIYFSEFFDIQTWKQISSKGWFEAVNRFIEKYPVFFDSRSPDAVPTVNNKYIDNLGMKEGLTNLGSNKKDYLVLEKRLFKKKLSELMEKYKSLDHYTFFKLIHLAYEKTIRNKVFKNNIFYHIHNPDTYSRLNFSRFAPNAKWIVMIREPIESCESWIKEPFENNNYLDVSMRICIMLLDISRDIFNKNNSIGVRLEDLKEKPKATIKKICKWMNIKEEKSLYKMTVQGKKWWGDKSSPNSKPFGKVYKSNKKTIFSKKDIFFFDTLFYPFKIKFKYLEENPVKFKKDLRTIRPMMKETFDFEKKIIKETGITEDQFKKSGAFLHLRATIMNRWTILIKNNTYPNMIKPLKVH